MFPEARGAVCHRASPPGNSLASPGPVWVKQQELPGAAGQRQGWRKPWQEQEPDRYFFTYCESVSIIIYKSFYKVLFSPRRPLICCLGASDSSTNRCYKFLSGRERAYHGHCPFC